MLFTVILNIRKELVLNPNSKKEDLQDYSWWARNIFEDKRLKLACDRLPKLSKESVKSIVDSKQVSEEEKRFLYTLALRLRSETLLKGSSYPMAWSLENKVYEISGRDIPQEVKTLLLKAKKVSEEEDINHKLTSIRGNLSGIDELLGLSVYVEDESTVEKILLLTDKLSVFPNIEKFFPIVKEKLKEAFTKEVKQELRNTKERLLKELKKAKELSEKEDPSLKGPKQNFLLKYGSSYIEDASKRFIRQILSENEVPKKRGFFDRVFGFGSRESRLSLPQIEEAPRPKYLRRSIIIGKMEGVREIEEKRESSDPKLGKALRYASIKHGYTLEKAPKEAPTENREKEFLLKEDREKDFLLGILHFYSEGEFVSYGDWMKEVIESVDEEEFKNFASSLKEEEKITGQIFDFLQGLKKKRPDKTFLV